jgi:hypothetical protein
MTHLLQTPSPTRAQIAQAVTCVLQRNVEARIYHWHKLTGAFPPSHRLNDTG